MRHHQRRKSQGKGGYGQHQTRQRKETLQGTEIRRALVSAALSLPVNWTHPTRSVYAFASRTPALFYLAVTADEKSIVAQVPLICSRLFPDMSHTTYFLGATLTRTVVPRAESTDDRHALLSTTSHRTSRHYLCPAAKICYAKQRTKSTQIGIKRSPREVARSHGIDFATGPLHPLRSSHFHCRTRMAVIYPCLYFHCTAVSPPTIPPGWAGVPRRFLPSASRSRVG